MAAAVRSATGRLQVGLDGAEKGLGGGSSGRGTGIFALAVTRTREEWTRDEQRAAHEDHETRGSAAQAKPS